MTQQRFFIPRIISGGQTGADQGALSAARDLGFETGGWAPRDFVTENGPMKPLLAGYGLKDSNFDYVGRTNLNTRDSDFTLWFGKINTPGYYATARSCRKNDKRFVEAERFPDEALAIMVNSAAVVNVAGNRESSNPGIFVETRVRMLSILRIVVKMRGWT